MTTDATRASYIALPEAGATILAEHPRRGLLELDLLLADFLVKKVAWEVSVPSDQDLPEGPESDAERDAVDRLICFRCSTIAEVQKKARIISAHQELSEAAEVNFGGFLTSLLPAEEVTS